jgi:hypothetical protein
MIFFIPLILSVSASAAITPVIDPNGPQYYALSEHRYLTTYLAFQNSESEPIEKPFWVQWKAYPYDSSTCLPKSVSTLTAEGRSLSLIGIQYIAGLRKSVTSFIANVDLSSSPTLLGSTPLTEGWYCLVGHVQDETYTHPVPFCYEPSTGSGNSVCAADVRVELKIQPNPASEYIVLNLTNLNQNTLMGSLMIFDSIGQLVLSQNQDFSEQSSRRVDVSMLSAGWYTVFISGLGRNVSESFMKL